MIEFQSGHPVRGATRPQRPRKALCPNFNPRAPCGARRDRRCGDHARADISIHAPRVGRDVQILGRVVELRAFQSTRPVWGATTAGACRLPCGSISIHAPRVGRDDLDYAKDDAAEDFNPRAPCGARPVCLCSHPARTHFNPRAPCGARPGSLCVTASITQHFNPRAPCGARPGRGCSCRCSCRNFNPRAPCGARPSPSRISSAIEPFQSTRPVWGATI